MQEYKKFTPKTLFELANYDPIVYHCLADWRGGDVTFEQSLIRMVTTLSEANRRLAELAKVEMVNKPPVLKFYEPDSGGG